MKWIVLGLFFINVAQADSDNSKRLATYSAAASVPVAPAATDICKISGSSSRVIRVHSVGLSSSQNAAGTNHFYLVKRFTDNSGGGLIAMTPVKYDSAMGNSAASTVAYITNPTLGLSTVTIKSFFAFAGSLNSYAQPSDVVYEYNDIAYGQPVTLKNQNEVLAINYNGSTVPSQLTVDCSFEWTEE